MLSEKKKITCWDIAQRKSNKISSKVYSGDTDQLIIGLVRLVGGFPNNDAIKDIKKTAYWTI